MRARLAVIGVISIVILVVLAIVLIPRLTATAPAVNQAYWPTKGWQTSTPEEQGFDSGRLADGLTAMEEDRINIDSLLIVRNGNLLLDAYFYPYDDTIPHNLASVTKSVMTTLIGIAVDQGKVQLDQPIVSFFPDRTIANLDARKEKVTVRHLASMMNGFTSGCLRGDERTLDAMRASPDWVQAALDRKMAQEPGVSFCYDSPGMHLLSAILQKATRMTALDFATQYLFEPLGIHGAFWESDPQGYTHGWGDLYLEPRDAAKIGFLWLNGGAWEGKQIVSATWVADSVTAHSHAGGDDYGYGWWVAGDGYYAAGRGGQYIRVYPSSNAIVVMTAAGADYGQIEPSVAGAFVDPNAPLPPDPASMAELNATLAGLAQSPRPWPVGPLPDMASTISGKTYVFGPNEVELTSLRLEFGDSTEAKQVMRLEGADVVWPIGLDGEYRVAPDGRGLRGYWADPETFVIEVFDIGLSTLLLHYVDDRLEISSPELGFQVEGQIENP